MYERISLMSISSRCPSYCLSLSLCMVNPLFSSCSLFCRFTLFCLLPVSVHFTFIQQYQSSRLLPSYHSRTSSLCLPILLLYFSPVRFPCFLCSLFNTFVISTKAPGNHLLWPYLLPRSFPPPIFSSSFSQCLVSPLSLLSRLPYLCSVHVLMLPSSTPSPLFSSATAPPQPLVTSIVALSRQ